MLGPPILTLNSYEQKLLESSINIVSLTIHESAIDYPIKVFGTVIARDQVDYKCVYLFSRDKNDPQVINSPVCICFSISLIVFFVTVPFF